MKENSKEEVICDTERKVVYFQDFEFHVVLCPLTLIENGAKQGNFLAPWQTDERITSKHYKSYYSDTLHRWLTMHIQTVK